MLATMDRVRIRLAIEGELKRLRRRRLHSVGLLDLAAALEPLADREVIDGELEFAIDRHADEVLQSMASLLDSCGIMASDLWIDLDSRKPTVGQVKLLARQLGAPVGLSDYTRAEVEVALNEGTPALLGIDFLRDTA